MAYAHIDNKIVRTACHQHVVHVHAAQLILGKQQCRVSDLAMSPSCTEDSDAIPATVPQGQRAVTSGQPNARARRLDFCKPLSIMHLLLDLRCLLDASEQLLFALLKDLHRILYKAWQYHAGHNTRYNGLHVCGCHSLRHIAVGAADLTGMLCCRPHPYHARAAGCRGPGWR